MNDKKKPEPKTMDGIMVRITGAIESLMKRQDILSERVMNLEQRLNDKKEK